MMVKSGALNQAATVERVLWLKARLRLGNLDTADLQRIPYVR